MKLPIWIVVLTARTCAGAEKLLSAEAVEAPQGHWTTNIENIPNPPLKLGVNVTNFSTHNVWTKRAFEALEIPPWYFDSTNWSLMLANDFTNPIAVVHDVGQSIECYGIDYTHKLDWDSSEPWDTNKFHVGVTRSFVLTTNVSERWPTHLENDFSRPWIQATVQNAIGYMKWTPDSNPTNKWIRTTIRRQTFVDFTVEGTPFRGLLKEETLFDKEVEWVLERTDKWKEKQ